MGDAVYLHVPLSKAEARALIDVALGVGLHPRFYLATVWRREAIEQGLMVPEAAEPRIRRLARRNQQPRDSTTKEDQPPE